MDALTVCIEHGRFIPCRKAGDHEYTQSVFWVDTVRDYHAGIFGDAPWDDIRTGRWND